MNNEKACSVIPGRGLRQGDSLSPYLYILCKEDLSSLIKSAERSGYIHGIKICRRAPIVSHLLFADDSLLFMRAVDQEVEFVKDLLHRYELASGQAINFDKSAMIFSNNVQQQRRRSLAGILGVQEKTDVGNYLGIPSLIGKNKRQTFQYIKDRIWKKVSSWKGKTLSMAGREVLIKSVAQAIPAYCMSMYLLPPSLGDEIQKNAKFLLVGCKKWRK